MKKPASLAIIFVTIFIDLAGFGMILPILPFYAESFGASALQIGLLSGSYSMMQFLFMPIWGRISDRIGRRPIILMSLLGSAGSLAFFGFANSLPALFLARILAGTFTANISTAQAYIADITTPENRARGMGLLGAAFGLGFILGPTIGGVLSKYGLGIPAYFAAGMALLNFVSALFLLPESRTKEAIARSREHQQKSRFNLQNLREAVLHPLVGMFLILFFFITLAFTNLEATFALMTERNFGYNAQNNGYLFAFIGIISVIMQGGLIGPLSKRFGEGRLLTSGLIFQSIGFFFLPYAGTLPSLLVFIAFVSVGTGLSTPSLQSLISRHTDADRQGGVLGVSQSLSSLARMLGPAWGGWFFDAIGVPAPYWSGGILLLACAGLSLFAMNRLTKHRRAEELVGVVEG